MKTVKQLADELGVSRQAVYKKIKKLELSTSLQRVDNVVYIDVDSEKRIKAGFKENSCKPVDSEFTVNVNNQFTASLQQTINILQAQTEHLQQQIATKDTQIQALQAHVEALTQTLSDTTAALKAAQTLHAADKPQLLLTDPEPEPTKKRSLWQRIRRKEK